MTFADKALALYPNYTIALEWKSSVLYSLGDYSEAIKYFDKILSIDPRDTYALVNKDISLDKLKQQEKQPVENTSATLSSINQNKNQRYSIGNNSHLADYTVIVYMVASEEIEPQWGWNYSSVLKSLTTHPEQDGSSFGKAIADSFFRKYRSISVSQGYDAYKEATLSVVNLTEVAQLVNDLNNFADYLSGRITDFTSVTSFTKSIGFSEGYGKTTKGNSGLVDIYDLSSNIKEQFPQSANLVDIVQKHLRNTIVYKINGSANPNSHGLSIYMPISEGEFTEARKYTLDSWQKIVDFQYRLTKSDHVAPFVQSTLIGDNIKGHINANDIAKVALWIYTTSMPEGNTAIYQDLDPSSFIRSDGSFEFKWNKQILSLCDEKNLLHSCKPVLTDIEVNKNKKFAFIPIRLQSKIDNLNEYVSLKYEISKEGNFTLLGARPEMGNAALQHQPVPKENWPIYPNDKVHPIVYTFNSEDDVIDNLIKVEHGPVKATDSFKPKYITYNGTFDVQLRVCDYSNNCWSTRWFHFNETSIAQPQIMDLLGHKILPCKDSVIMSNLSTYANPTFKFKMQYPSNWKMKDNGIPDTAVVFFIPPGFDVYGYPGTVHVDAGYWPGTQKEFLDENTPSRIYDPFLKVISFNSTNLGGFPAYEAVTTSLGSEDISVDALIGHTWYTIDFNSKNPAKLSNYLPYFKSMMNSFEICTTNRANHQGHQSNGTDTMYNQSSIHRTTTLSTYVNSVYGFKIQYPSNLIIQEGKNIFTKNPQSDILFSFLPAIVSESPLLFNEFKRSTTLQISVLPGFDNIIKNGLTLEKFAKTTIDLTGRDVIGLNITKSKPINFKGNSAYEIVYTLLGVDKIKLKHQFIVTIVGHNGYLFDYGGELSNYEKFLPIVTEMLDSFDATSNAQK
jgi:tetratricopeptide (TPR) repeat protein